MLLPIFILIVSLVNLLSGLWLLITTRTFSTLTIFLLSIGIVASVLLCIICIVKPKGSMEWPKCVRKLFTKHHLSTSLRSWNEEEDLNPENAEVILKNLKGIPFLIQAIQYSMETTCYSNTKNMDNRILRTAVIHTAPACKSSVDSDDESIPANPTPRHSGPEELWTPVGSSLWNNAQLNLSLTSGASDFQVFPYTEANSHRGSRSLSPYQQSRGKTSLEEIKPDPQKSSKTKCGCGEDHQRCAQKSEGTSDSKEEATPRTQTEHEFSISPIFL